MTRPPTVAHVILSHQLAGTERHVAELCCGLRARGWRTLIVVRKGFDSTERRVFEGTAEVREVPELPYPLLVPKLARIVRREGVQLLHGHLGDGTVLSLGAGLLTRVPVLSTAHFMVPRHTLLPGARLRAVAYRTLLQRLAAIIAVSSAVELWLKSAVDSTRVPIHVIHEGIGCLDPAADVEPSHTGRVILYAGRLSHEKQPDLLIRAMPLLHGSPELWIAGRGPIKDAMEQLAGEVAPGRVRFLGFVPDLKPYLGQARLLAIPSKAEGFGLVALEAMRAARPVVGFASGALPEIVRAGETGLLARPHDLDDLASAMQRLIDDESLAERMGEAGRSRFFECFTVDRMAEATERVYKEVLARGPAVQPRDG